MRNMFIFFAVFSICIYVSELRQEQGSKSNQETIASYTLILEQIKEISTQLKISQVMLQIIASNTRLIELYKEPSSRPLDINTKFEMQLMPSLVK